MQEGKGYEEHPIAALLAGFAEERSRALALVRSLTPQQWSRRGTLRDATTSLMDLGIWVANHDLGHLAQIRRCCEAEKS